MKGTIHSAFMTIGLVVACSAEAQSIRVTEVQRYAAGADFSEGYLTWNPVSCSSASDGPFSCHCYLMDHVSDVAANRVEVAMSGFGTYIGPVAGTYRGAGSNSSCVVRFEVSSPVRYHLVAQGGRWIASAWTGQHQDEGRVRFTGPAIDIISEVQKPPMDFPPPEWGLGPPTYWQYGLGTADRIEMAGTLIPGAYELQAAFAAQPPPIQSGIFPQNSAYALLEFSDACDADFNRDGGVDGADVGAFFESWSMGVDAADLNADGGVDGQDLFYFFERWRGGC
jgi:hypothetical protein